MRGTITGKEVFLHSLTIVRLWGVATFLACAWRSRGGRAPSWASSIRPRSPKATAVVGVASPVTTA